MLCMFNILVLVVHSEYVPAMFDPVTKQLKYYSPPAAEAKKGIMITVDQHVHVESSTHTSKSESFDFDLKLVSEVPSVGVSYNKVKIHETKQQSHHQVNMVINIPADCNQACEENAKQAFQLANNALHGGSQQKRVN